MLCNWRQSFGANRRRAVLCGACGEKNSRKFKCVGSGNDSTRFLTIEFYMFAVNSHRFRIQFEFEFDTLESARDLIGHRVLQRSCYFVKLLKQLRHVGVPIGARSPRR
jgi:hypothetical protein